MIIKAEVKDAPALHELNCEFNGENCITLEGVKESLANPQNEIVFVCYDGESESAVPVGFVCGMLKKSACYADISAELTELYVRAEYRRKGIASQLVAALEAELSALGVQHMMVLTGDDNLAAQRLYESFGYEKNSEVELEKEL